MYYRDTGRCMSGFGGRSCGFPNNVTALRTSIQNRALRSLASLANATLPVAASASASGSGTGTLNVTVSPRLQWAVCVAVTLCVHVTDGIA